MKIMIAYSSMYGASAYYAELLAEELGITAKDLSNTDNIEDADLLIYFGGLYAGTINGLKKATSHLPDGSMLILCTVGLADPSKDKTRDEIMELSKKLLQGRTYRIFMLRGDMDYSRLTIKHKAMMWALINFLKSKKNRTEGDEALIETYGGKLDFKNPDAIRPIVEFVRKTMKSRR